MATDPHALADRLGRLVRELCLPVAAPAGFEWNSGGYGNGPEVSALLESGPDEFLRAAPGLVPWLERAEAMCIDMWFNLDIAKGTLVVNLEGLNLDDYLRREGLDELAERMRGPGQLRDMVSAVAEALQLMLKPHPVAGPSEAGKA